MKLYQLRYLLNMEDDEEIIVEQFEKLYPNGKTYTFKVTVVAGKEADQ